MILGISCFNDFNFINIIKEKNEFDICELTGKSEFVYDTTKDNKIQNQLIDLIEIFSVSVDNRGKMLIDYFIEWNTFNLDREKIELVLRELIKDKLISTPEFLTKKLEIPDYDDLSILYKCSWTDFSKHIKYKNRYHSNNLINENNLGLFLETLKSTIVPTDNKYYFRVRICSKDDMPGFSFDQMGPPPIEMSTSGRISPEGIRCLYLSEDKNTCYFETRVRNHDNVTIGYFEPIEEIQIIDFSKVDVKKLSPFGPFIPDFAVVNFHTIIDIFNDIEKPIRPFDSKLDYVPTQFICDYIKGVLKCDGICYRSTVETNGKNYAIFNYDKFRCVKVENKLLGLETKYVEIK